MSSTVVTTLAWIVLGYLIGAIPTGLWLTRARGIDISKVGSGNIGATNVLRAMGPAAAIFVAVMDPVKAALAVSLPIVAGEPRWVVAATSVAVVLGNTYNVFRRFKGGKGVATSLGAFAPIDPIVSLLAAVLGITAIGLGRFVSLGAVVGVLSGTLFVLARSPLDGLELALTATFGAISLLRHAENLRKLAAGTERRLGEAKAAPRA